MFRNRFTPQLAYLFVFHLITFSFRDFRVGHALD
jgi:hypothetical protein